MFICASPLGEAQLNRMLDRCRPLGPASPTGRVNTWPSSTLTPASTADLRPRPTCSATSASVLLRFIRWCSRLSVKVGYERSPASPAASRCSSIPNACLSYANLNPSNPLGRGTSRPDTSIGTAPNEGAAPGEQPGQREPPHQHGVAARPEQSQRHGAFRDARKPPDGPQRHGWPPGPRRY